MLPDRYTFDHETLPAARRAIRDIGMLRDGEAPTAAEVAADARDALYNLLGIIHDLADAHYEPGQTSPTHHPSITASGRW